jgi:hypothetical protein
MRARSLTPSGERVSIRKRRFHPQGPREKKHDEVIEATSAFPLLPYTSHLDFDLDFKLKPFVYVDGKVDVYV